MGFETTMANLNKKLASFFQDVFLKSVLLRERGVLNQEGMKRSHVLELFVKLQLQQILIFRRTSVKVKRKIHTVRNVEKRKGAGSVSGHC